MSSCRRAQFSRPFWIFVMLKKVLRHHFTLDPAAVLLFFMENIAHDSDNLCHGWAHLARWLTNIHYCQISLDWNNCHSNTDRFSIVFVSFFPKAVTEATLFSNNFLNAAGQKVQIRTYTIFSFLQVCLFFFIRLSRLPIMLACGESK